MENPSIPSHATAITATHSLNSIDSSQSSPADRVEPMSLCDLKSFRFSDNAIPIDFNLPITLSSPQSQSNSSPPQSQSNSSPPLSQFNSSPPLSQSNSSPRAPSSQSELILSQTPSYVEVSVKNNRSWFKTVRVSTSILLIGLSSRFNRTPVIPSPTIIL